MGSSDNYVLSIAPGTFLLIGKHFIIKGFYEEPLRVTNQRIHEGDAIMETIATRGKKKQTKNNRNKLRTPTSDLNVSQSITAVLQLCTPAHF